MFYNPFSLLFTGLLALLLFFVISLLFIGALRTAFTRIGFSWNDALLLLLASLIGSGINIPLRTLESSIPIIREGQVRVFGVTYRVPYQSTVINQTLLAVNLGGAVIPTLVSLYLLTQFPEAILYSLAGAAIVALVTHIVARPVRGVGIVTPALLPPITAAISSALLVYLGGGPHDLVFVIAYFGGTMGTLVGADLMNLSHLADLGAPVASIGGAGTFDGVFLTGLIAVLLV